MIKFRIPPFLYHCWSCNESHESEEFHEFDTLDTAELWLILHCVPRSEWPEIEEVSEVINAN